MLTPKVFWTKAAQWGSFMRNGDPGACMYGFDESGTVQSEEHRKDCLDYIEAHCRAAAKLNDDPEACDKELDQLVEYLKATPFPVRTLAEFDEFTAAYITAALWAGTDDSDTPLDANYSAAHIHPDTIAAMVADCARFREDPRTATAVAENLSGAGHDFLLTRNGHGAGFWDGDWPEEVGTYLTDRCRTFGQIDFYVGDDGRIHA